MNGAESLVHTLLAGDVEVCFANPGTSEMHFVAALDRIDGMRCVLGLFEGVVTGAADGYGRMKDRPAATLLHLGPGLGNGLANLHNAKRAGSPIVNIVGDHAGYHRQYDSPLTSDVEGTARPFSHWVRTSPTAAALAGDAAEAIAFANTRPGKIATLILPADTAWTQASGVIPTALPPPVPKVEGAAVTSARKLLAGGNRVGLILGARALRSEGLDLAGRIAAQTGIRILASNLVPRIERGAGRVPVETIPYAVDAALAFLRDFDHLILAGGIVPVAFFAYPGKPSLLAPAGCAISTLALPGDDVVDALTRLCDAAGANRAVPDRLPLDLPSPAAGALSPAGLGQSLAALIPENAIVVEELVTVGANFVPATRLSRPHDWLKNMGGSIGFAMPAATGAAIACPDRKVLCLQADGSAMYTLQALWTQAREKLNVTTVVFANRTYAILRAEFNNVDAGTPGPRARSMLEIGGPDLDWCQLARGMGVEAVRVTDMEGFNQHLADALAATGPRFIEVVV